VFSAFLIASLILAVTPGPACSIWSTGGAFIGLGVYSVARD
jgi:hypothetical protein